tara:strand:+ start:156 stop:464 length:309 start_codon:yes stop_codon:yes gene_type:complete
MANVTAAITAQNNFTDKFEVVGHFNLSISGTFVANVVVQRSFDGGSAWLDTDTFTAPYEGVGYDAEKLFYRVGVKTGGFTSGTVNVRLSDNKDFSSKDVFVA